MTIPAFLDSVDVSNAYEVGVCGIKQFSLEAGSPSFLTASQNNQDPIGGPITIIFDQTEATQAEVIQLFTVNFRVSVVEYSDFVSDYVGTFNFQIAPADE